jgi:hypothetical protein
MVKSMVRRMINFIFSLPAHKNVNILLILSEDVNLSAQLALPQFFLFFANGLGKSFSKAS